MTTEQPDNNPTVEEEIANFASILMTRREVCTALDIPFDTFLDNASYLTAYQDGLSLSIATHKQKVKLLAEQGSSPAQNLFEKHILDLKLKTIDELW